MPLRVGSDRAPVVPTATRRRPKPRLAKTKKERVASSLFTLPLDIHDLRLQIRELALQRALLLARPRALTVSPVPSTDSSLFLKIDQLFRVFNRGYRVRDDAPRTLVQTLTGGSDTTLFTRWRTHADAFALTRCVIESIRVVGDGSTPSDDHDDHDHDDHDDKDTAVACVLRVDVTSYGTVTADAVRRAWPSVLHDPVQTQALLGRAMATPMAFHFAFSRTGHVVWFSIKPDFATAFARVVAETETTDVTHPCHVAGGHDGVVVQRKPPAPPTDARRHGLAFLLS